MFTARCWWWWSAPRVGWSEEDEAGSPTNRFAALTFTIYMVVVPRVVACSSQYGDPMVEQQSLGEAQKDYNMKLRNEILSIGISNKLLALWAIICLETSRAVFHPPICFSIKAPESPRPYLLLGREMGKRKLYGYAINGEQTERIRDRDKVISVCLRKHGWRVATTVKFITPPPPVLLRLRASDNVWMATSTTTTSVGGWIRWLWVSILLQIIINIKSFQAREFLLLQLEGKKTTATLWRMTTREQWPFIKITLVYIFADKCGRILIIGALTQYVHLPSS